MCKRVFVFEETHLDISKLRRFGDILYLFHRGEQKRPLRDIKLEDQIASQLTRFNYDPEEDYLAIVGQQLTITIFLTTVVSLWGRCRTLCFDAGRSEYYEREMGRLAETEFVEMS